VNRLLLAVTCLLPVLAVADVDPRFARLRDGAEPLGSLGTFLDSFIGECGGFFTRSSCQRDAEAFRKRYTEKPLYLILNEEQAAALLSAGPYQPGSGQYSIQVRPIFPGGGYTLTHGLPPQTDGKGNPVLPLIHVPGTTPQGGNAQSFLRLFSERQIRVQVVFTPLAPWSLPRRDGGKAHGVHGRVEALLLTHGRTGAPLGLWFPEDGLGAGKQPRGKGSR
jgi:Family of unknown function (DUF6066)